MILKTPKPNIINIGSLWHKSKFYSFKKARLVEDLANRCKGKALVVVDPLFCAKGKYKKELLTNQLLIKHGLDQSDYSVYLKRLKKKISSTKRPICVFYDGNRYIEKWMSSLNKDRLFIFIKTAYKGKPTPVLHKNEEKAWEYLANALLGLHISDIEITGEMTFLDESGRSGCVFYVEDWFSKFPFIKSTVTLKLTFPNTFIPSFAKS